MTDKSSKADLNIYFAKPEVTIASEVLKDISTLKSYDLQVSGIIPCKLYIKNNFQNPPRWANFFSPDISSDVFGMNSSTGSVLYAKIGTATFVLTFGQGHHMIDTTNIEMNFGLKTCLNLVDVSSLRSIDKSSFEQHPTQTREQTGIATELQYFGVNIERDLLRAITGKPKNEKYGSRISGMDALKLSVEIKLQDLASLLGRLLKAYNDDAYKQGPFAWVDHIGEVKDKVLHEKLDNELLSRIEAKNFGRIWLSVPEIIDWDRVVGFRYSRYDSRPRCYDVRISEFMDTLKDVPLDVAVLNRRKIFCVDSEDVPLYEKPAYRFIYAEVDYQSDVYVLNNGKWYKINSGFANQVNSYFATIPKYTKTLPIFDDDTEGKYNERVTRDGASSFVLLDKQNIQIPGAVTPVEPCDLLRDGNEFIHVKRYSGSSVLSHLFNQGLVSGELFQMEAEFRKLLNAKLPAKFALSDPSMRPKRNDYHVVFAIISESDEQDLSMPFFSKISLKHVIMRLESIGFNVAVAKIPVDEKRKITKKWTKKRKGFNKKSARTVNG